MKKVAPFLLRFTALLIALVVLFAVYSLNFGLVALSVGHYVKAGSSSVCEGGLRATVSKPSGDVLLTSAPVLPGQNFFEMTTFPYLNYQQVVVEAWCYDVQGAVTGHVVASGRVSHTTMTERMQKVLVSPPDSDCYLFVSAGPPTFEEQSGDTPCIHALN